MGRRDARGLSISRQLRRRQTPAEIVLWSILRAKRLAGYKFRRQHVIDHFVIDFYSAHCRLAIEIDGGVHLERTSDDRRREEALRSKGIEVLRFWNNEVHEERELVIEKIAQGAVARVRRRKTT